MSRFLAYVIHLALACAAVGVTWAARKPTRPHSLWPALALVGAAAVFSFGVWSWGRATPFGDFNKAYYPAGRLVLTDPGRLYECQVDNLCFVNIPVVAALFTPLSALAPTTARAVFTVAGIAAVVAATWLLVRTTGASGWRRYAIVGIVLLNGPLYYSARLGNLSHVLLLPLLLALRGLASGRDAAAGVTLAIVAVIKPPFFLFLPYFLLRRRWWALAGMGLATAAVVALSILWVGLDLHRTWVRDYVIAFSARPIAAYNVQSISGALARFVAPGHSVDWHPLEIGPLFTVGRYILTLTCLATALVVCAARGDPKSAAARWSESSVVLCLALLVSPITWTHYYCALVIPLALYVGRSLLVPTGLPWVAAAIFSGLAISLPVVLPQPTNPLFTQLLNRLLLSHYVIGAAGLLAILLLGLHATPAERVRTHSREATDVVNASARDR